MRGAPRGAAPSGSGPASSSSFPDPADRQQLLNPLSRLERAGQRAAFSIDRARKEVQFQLLSKTTESWPSRFRVRGSARRPAPYATFFPLAHRAQARSLSSPPQKPVDDVPRVRVGFPPASG